MSDNENKNAWNWPRAFAAASKASALFGIIYAMAQCAAVRP